MALTDSKHKQLYAQTILRLESLKKNDKDPIAIAQALQISFVRIAAEFKENLDHLQNICNRAMKILVKLESQNVTDTSSLNNRFNEYLDSMEQYMDFIKHIIERFNTSQQIIIKEQIKIDDILVKHSAIMMLLYKNDKDITDDIDECKIAMQSLCEDITTSQENLTTLGIQLFPIPQASTSSGGKKNKAT